MSDGDKKTRTSPEQGRLPLDGADGDGAAAPAEESGRPSWLESMDGRQESGAEARRGAARIPMPAAETDSNGARTDDGATVLDRSIERLREEARRTARADAAHDVPGPDATTPPDSEMELQERCRALFQRWFTEQRRKTAQGIAAAEERASEKLGQISLGIDRFQRFTNELIRLKVRYSLRKEEVTDELQDDRTSRRRAIPTPVYAVALVFLGMVEFFANAPVFAALLPRDPLTERQIRVLTETSEGWFAGLERAMAHLIFRPEATLLAAGVIIFLLVLCHFFGASLRELVMQRERKERRYTVQARSAMENTVPLILTTVGIVLVLGVLYDARVTLGEVGQERYEQDIAQVQEYQREAGWLRVDGELLAANELTNRADDMQEAAIELREYSQSMARMTFPILLLNLTLVLCAICAAYFHRRDARKEHFNESPFEDQREEFIERAETVASETSKQLADVVRDIREMKAFSTMGPMMDWPSVVHQLESVITLYRSENGRARGIDPRSIPAFANSASLEIREPTIDTDLATRSPADYEAERAELAKRFNEVRSRFNEEATASW